MAFGTYTKEVEEYNSITKVIVAVQRYRFLEEFKRFDDSYGQSSHVIVRRDMAQQTGYFNPHLRMHEDKEFCIRASSAGYKINTYGEFEANHLKIYSTKSLINDHFDKTYLAIRWEWEYPAIFTRVTNLMKKEYKITWLGSFLLPFLIALLFAVDFLSTGFVFFLLFVVLFAPVFSCHETFDNLDLKEKFTGVFYWPIIGGAISFGAAKAIFVNIFSSIRKKVDRLSTLLVCGWRVLRRNGMPVNIIHFVTSRCNLRCEHCFYKETLDAKDPGEQSLQQFEKTTREIGPVLWYAIGGGEPFVRGDIAELAGVILKNCRPLMVTIPTNGWYVEKTFIKTLEILQQMDGRQLTVQISLDGPQQIHDRIRGEDSWSRAQETFRRLKGLQELYPNLSLGIITVVNQGNLQCYPDFVDELVETFSPNQIAINLFRNTTLDGPPVADEITDAYKAAVERYEWHLQQGNLKALGYLGARIMRAKEVLQKELIYRVVRNNEFVTPCTAGTLNYVIWEDGRVAPCEVLGESVGNIMGEGAGNDFRAIVSSSEAIALRKKIRDEKCKCSYECAMTMNTLFSWPMTRKMLHRLIKGSE